MSTPCGNTGLGPCGGCGKSCIFTSYTVQSVAAQPTFNGTGPGSCITDNNIASWVQNFTFNTTWNSETGYFSSNSSQPDSTQNSVLGGPEAYRYTCGLGSGQDINSPSIVRCRFGASCPVLYMILEVQTSITDTRGNVLAPARLLNGCTGGGAASWWTQGMIDGYYPMEFGLPEAPNPAYKSDTNGLLPGEVARVISFVGVLPGPGFYGPYKSLADWVSILQSGSDGIDSIGDCRGATSYVDTSQICGSPLDDPFTGGAP